MALLPEWLDSFEPGKNDFKFVKFEVNELKPFLHWKSRTWTFYPARITRSVGSHLVRPGLSGPDFLEVPGSEAALLA